MNKSDFGSFSDELKKTAVLLNKPEPSGRYIALFFDEMQQFELDQVLIAIRAHRADPQRGRFMPTPADLIEKIQAVTPRTGHVSANEAWLIAINAADERNTVVWTEPIAAAWDACKAVFSEDEQAARMGFRDAYERLCREFDAAGGAVRWRVMQGWDREGRELAIEKAYSAGRICMKQRRHYLELSAPVAVESITHLIEMQEKKPNASVVSLQEIERMKAILSQPKINPRELVSEQERAELAERKRAMRGNVEAYLQKVRDAKIQGLKHE